MHPGELQAIIGQLYTRGAAFLAERLGYTPANRAGDTFTGNVGIGAAPGANLHVNFGNTPAAAQEVERLEVTGNSAAGRGPLLTFYAPNDGGSSKIAAQIGGVTNGAANTGGYLSFGTSATGAGTTPTERLRITNVGQHALQTLGAGYSVKEGANAKMGTAVLVAGTVTVNTTAVTANSRIFLTAQTTGAAPGALRVSAVTAGTSFTITSTSATDTSTVAWVIFEPS
jgi:hypothetical protein